MASAAEIKQLFEKLPESFVAEKAEGIDATIQFDLSGENGGQYWAKISNGSCEVGEGVAENPKMTLKATADDFYALASGSSNPMQMFMTGKLKVVGDMGLAMKMQGFFKF